MSDVDRPSIDQRKAEVQRRVTLSAVVEAHVKLSGSGGSKRRGKCPFHGSNSPSLALFDADKGTGRAFCFGCQWSGDVFAFQRDIRGIDFMAALDELEALAGIARGGEASTGAGPVQRERNPTTTRRPERPMITPLDMARAIWRRARPDPLAVRRYFEGRGVPAMVLTEARIAPFRYLGECPCVPWPAGDGDPGSKRWPRETLVAPAIMAMVRQPLRGDSGELEFVPTALHVTYLNPAGDGTMTRRKPWASTGDPDPMLPKRRMLGPVGRGCIVLGDYRDDAPLFVGEGNETVLSALGLAEASDDVVGVATLSLDNLQGRPKLWKNGVWPLHVIEPDPERPPFTISGHRGAVTGLVDSDMAPLRGRRVAVSAHRGGWEEPGPAAAFEGLPIVERKGGPIVQRAITGAERARICGELVVKGWRAAGVADARAIRAPAGKDFNDVAREAQVA
jgi:DNA primase